MMWLLMLSIGTATLVQSCQKEPCEPCKEVDCNLQGTIAYEPSGCVTPPTGRIGIQGDDGIFYFINKDHTGQFADFEVGTRVVFGLCAVKDSEVSIQNNPTNQIWAPPMKEADLGCIRIGHHQQEPGECDQVAKIVSISYQPNGPESGERYLKIDGSIYAVQGDFAKDLYQYPIGTELLVGAKLIQGCYLPTVVTYPNIDGCAELTCLSPRFITN